MSPRPRVSVVLPVFQGEDYLADAIRSVLDQELEDWELVVVDDGSTDRSGAIAASFARRDPRVRVVTLAENRSLPAALNRGFAEARAPLWTWTSHDNLYRPSALRRLHEALSERPDAVLAAGDFTLVDGAGRPVGRGAAGDFAELIVRNCVRYAFLYRASAARRAGAYDPRSFLVEDWDYWLRLGRLGPFVHVPEDLYLARVHDRSLTASHREGRRPAVAAEVVARHLPAYRDAPAALRARAMWRVARHHPDPRTRFAHAARCVATDPGYVAWLANPVRLVRSRRRTRG